MRGCERIDAWALIVYVSVSLFHGLWLTMRFQIHGFSGSARNSPLDFTNAFRKLISAAVLVRFRRFHLEPKGFRRRARPIYRPMLLPQTSLVQDDFMLW